MSTSKKKTVPHYAKKTQKQKSTIPANHLEKQMLSDLEKRISLNVGNFLVLTEEGDPAQIALAHQKAKSEFLKFGPEMQRIAKNMDAEIGKAVAEYLDTIDTVLHCSGMLDDEKVSKCFNTTQRLAHSLKIQEN